MAVCDLLILVFVFLLTFTAVLFSIDSFHLSCFLNGLLRKRSSYVTGIL